MGWDAKDKPWHDFSLKFIGISDPAQADFNSLRGHLYWQWKRYKLQVKPSRADNIVHASASPYEGLIERRNWLGVTMEEDSFGKEWLENDLGNHLVRMDGGDWMSNPEVNVQGGGKGMLFDQFKGLNAQAFLDKAAELVKLNSKFI